MSYNGTVYGTVKLVAAVDVAVSKGAYIAGHVAAFFTNPIVLVILLAIVLALVGYILWLVRRRKRSKADAVVAAARRWRRRRPAAVRWRTRPCANLTAILPGSRRR